MHVAPNDASMFRDQLAAELHESEKSRVQVEHFSKRFPGMTVEDGYAISRAWVKTKIAEGRVARGHKIGLTSRAMQLSSQIDEPDYGTLLDDMFFAARRHPDGSLHRAARRGGAGLRAQAQAGRRRASSVDEVLAATDYVMPAIEIIDARIEQFDRHTKAMRKVLGHHQRQRGQCRHRAGRPQGAPARAVDLPWCGAILRQERRGRGNRPGRRRAKAIPPSAWPGWRMKLAPWGECLEAGEVVLAGSFTRPVAARKGDVFDADYGPLGRFDFRFI